MDYNSDYGALNCSCINNGTYPKNRRAYSDFRVKDTYSLHYITKGKGKVIVDENEYFVTAGESFLIFPFSAAVIEEDSANPLEYKWLEFRGLEAAWIVSQTAFSKKSPVIGNMPVKNFEKYFDVIYGDNSNLFSQCRSNANLMLLLSFYLENYPRKAIENNRYALVARDYIDKNYHFPDCNVKKVADYVKIDRTYLFRLFKEETGYSVIDYINNLRISKAAIMLRDETVSVKDVAFSVGFTDQMYFSKVFKKIRGTTPTEYRRSYLNHNFSTDAPN